MTVFFREGVEAAAGFDVAKFVESFAVLAEAPGGVKRLRELVLELAMRGTLVAQWDDEAPVKIGKADEFAIDPADAPFDIPLSWAWALLTRLARLDIGRTPPTKSAAHWAEGNDGHPWVSIGDMDHFGEVNATKRRVSDLAKSEVFRDQVVPKGTLLMSFKLTIGKVALLGCDGFHNEAIVSIYPQEPEMRDFLFRVLPLLTRLGASKNAVMGATLNRDSLNSLLIPVPPLAEQKRIVARVDELMRMLDDLEAKQAKKREVQGRLRAAALEALTAAEGPEEVEAAWLRMMGSWEVLLGSSADVAAFRRAAFQLTCSPAKDSKAAEGTWRQAQVGDLVECLDRLREPVRKDKRGADGESRYPYYGANGQVGWIDDFIFDEPLVLVVEDETFVGRTKPFAYRVEGKCWVNNHAHVLRPRADVDVDFLHAALAYYPFDRVVSGTTGRKKLTKAELLTTPVSIPHFPFQRESVRWLRGVCEICDELEAKLKAKEEAAAKLVEAVVRDLVA